MDRFRLDLTEESRLHCSTMWQNRNVKLYIMRVAPLLEVKAH